MLDSSIINEGKSRLYVNAQIVILLLKILKEYTQNRIKLEEVFSFAHMLQDRFNNKLYSELRAQIKELLDLEAIISSDKQNNIPSIINYVIWKINWHFIGEHL